MKTFIPCNDKHSLENITIFFFEFRENNGSWEIFIPLNIEHAEKCL